MNICIKSKRTLFWIILVLFVTLAVWWIFYFPFNPERLYRAIPANAILISEHEKLAERWETFVRNPLTRGLLTSVGIKRKDINEVIDNPDIIRMVHRLAKKNTVIAYVPSLGVAGKPAWIFASWVGGYGQLLRWGALSALIHADFKKIEIGSGRYVWVLETNSGSPNDPLGKLSFAVIEGVLLGCFSMDPAGVRYMVDRVESGASLVPQLSQRLRCPNDEKGLVLDRGWVNWYGIGKDARKHLKLSFGFILDEAIGSEGWVKGDFGMRNADPALAGRVADLSRFAGLRDSVLGALEGIFGDAPSMFITMPFAYVEPFLSRPDASEALKIAGGILETGITKDSFVFACLLSGDYSGRILTLKVPTIMVGIKIRDDAKMLDMVTDALDRLNAQYGWSLIPRSVNIGGYSSSVPSVPIRSNLPVDHDSQDLEVTGKKSGIVLDSTRGGIYSALNIRERPAFAEEEGWLILSSNMKTLNTLMDRSNEEITVQTGKKIKPCWLRGLSKGSFGEARDALAYAWADLDSSGKALKDAMAVYSLILGVRNTRHARETRENLEYIGVWLELLRSLKMCSIWLDSSGPEFSEGSFGEVRFRLGEDGRQPPVKRNS